MAKKIKFHKYAWQCPKCKRYKRVRNNGKNSRVAYCCGQGYYVTTRREIVETSQLVITDIKYFL